ncbi:germination lipoprotein GerS-related protein [Clostridium sp.]|uniref:germination lipoprotein GerS-related protein n=1 Tax=Clostridium sp. TaxID=1506 RepID=UPI002A91F114|nr:germination lipoprotein GerS-related protein [Clostridium sp.]MDY6012986.1 germination lipoprotein GerS-related protein [Clostridium sp.]
MKFFKKSKKSINNKEKDIKKKSHIKRNILITLLMIIPFISIILAILFRHAVAPTNEEIIEHVKNMKKYDTIAEYTISNNRATYNEKTKILFFDDHGFRIDFGEELTKLYYEDKIVMAYNKKNEKYEVKRDLDSLYPLGVMSEIFKNPVLEVSEGQQEWGDLQYLKVDFDLITNNNHLDKATLYIDKSKKQPLLIKIYDNKGSERVKIEYREFNKDITYEEENFEIKY